MHGVAATQMGGSSKLPPTEILAAYTLFILLGGAVWHLVADGEFSSILTMSVLLQCLAAVLLGLQMLSSGSAAGLSARALTLDAVALVCRLSSTLWLNGYLPVDASGDYIFQAIDLASLAILSWLLYRIFFVCRRSYQEEEDCLPIIPMIAGAFVLAFILHGNMNGRPLFDSLWMAGLFLNTIAVLPQLWLITRSGSNVEALTSHYIAAMAAGRALSGVFMWHARGDITCAPWFGEFNHAIWAILGAHVLHMLLLGDFGYYYVKSILSYGLNFSSMDLTDGCGV